MFGRLLAGVANWFRPRADAVPGPLSPYWYGPIGAQSTAGISVTPDRAMAVSAVFACTRVLGETLASLPWRVYRNTGENTKTQARDYYLWQTLHDRPNRWQTPIEWREMGMHHLAVRGNFYNRWIFNEEGNLELIPLNPDRVFVEQLADRRMRYIHRPAPGEEYVYGQDQIFHVRGLTINGLTGVSVLEFARNAVGSAIAQEEYGSSLFKNGGLPTFWIKRPKGVKWSREARENFRAGWRRLHAGPANAGNPPILEDDMELKELALTSRDTQWIESRGFTALDICRFFRIPPHMIGIMVGATFSNIEQQALEFVIFTLAPWAVRWEQAAKRDLVVDEAYYTKIMLDALLRGDMTSRYSAHNVAIQGGWMTPNEARAVEDLNPIPGGDEARFPLNMQPAGGGPDEQQQGGQPGKGTRNRGGGSTAPAEDEQDDTAYERRKRQNAELRATWDVLLEDAAGRIAAAELKGLASRADKAEEDRQRWNQWAVEFYRGHGRYIERTLSPLAAAWERQTGQALRLDTAVKALQSPVAPVFDSAVRIPDLIERWRTERTTTLFSCLKDQFYSDHAL